jgi:hypothetical protein
MSTVITRTTLNVPYEEKISSIIQEPINDEYGWGIYGDFRVIIRSKDGFINATKLCALHKSKRFDNWIRNDQSKKLIEYIKAVPHIRGTDITQTVEGGNLPLITGTYVHPHLAPHIASWVSPEFAVKVSQIVNNYIVRDYKEQVRVKDDKIDELSRKIDAQSEEMKKQSEKLDRQSEEINLLLEGSNRLERNLDVANENIVCALVTSGRVSERSVPLDRVAPSKKEQFVVIDLNKPGLQLPYCVIRGQDAYAQACITRKRRLYPELRMVVQLVDHPNSVELWNAVKTRMGGDMLFFPKTNRFRLENVTEEEFVEAVYSCDAEKRRLHQEMLDVIMVEEDIEEEKEMKAVEYRGEDASLEEEPVEEDIQATEEEPVEEDIQATEEEPVEESVRVVTAASLMRLKLQELKEMCRQNRWRGWSKLNKPNLVEFIVSLLNKPML